MVRVLVRLLLALGMVVVVAGAAGYLWLRSSLPQTSGTIVVKGLSAPVTIVRDAHGIPTIKAANARDAAFGLGFVSAQDRLFQMDLMRHYAAGRLSEWFGKATLATDESMRTLGLYRAAQAQLKLLSPELRAVYDAYAAGVNAYLATRRDALPPEYAALRVGVAPWTPADSLAWGKIMDLQLTGNYRRELLRVRLARRLTPAQLAVLFPGYPAKAPVTLARLSRALPGLPRALPASNDWVVDGRHSGSGKPLLANDTHLDFSAPGVWYLVRIETPKDTLAGVTSPGEPMIVLGHNTHIAWGFTTTGGDVEDLFVEKVDPVDPSKYLTPGGWQPFVTRKETIRVHGAKPVMLTVRSTRHGPVIAKAGRDEVLALEATWLQGDDRTPQALWDATHAHDWRAFHAAFRNAVAPEQNIVYADVDGNIGFTAPARIPIRAHGDGTVPEPGWSGQFDWIGWVPFNRLPTGFDPPSGRFFSANNKIVPDSYPYLITRDWELPYRAERINALLDEHPVQTPATAAAMQADIDSPVAHQLLPLMLAATPKSAAGKEALQRLRSWNGRMTRGAVAPLLFVAWLRDFNRQILAAKLGPLFGLYWSLHPEVIASILTKHRDWCDDRATPQVENCPQELGAALDRAMAGLKRRYGRDMNDWRWGNVHRARFPHAIWSRLPLIGSWLGVVIPDQGGQFTLDNAAMFIGDEAHPFTAVHGPTLRMIVDLAAPAKAQFMIAPGESGNLLSPHYADLLRTWRNVGYIRFTNDASGGILKLKPR